jgi:predicted nucleic acid-binding protein
MILIDTSIWIDHLRSPVDDLVKLLNAGRVIHHPHVTVELALGSIRDRGNFLGALACLPQMSPVDDGNLLRFIDEKGLMAKGIRYVDCQLLVSCIEGGRYLWTRDKRLADAASVLGIEYRPN